MARQSTWQAVKGDLIHRCALHAAGKWLTVPKASELARDGEQEEPLLVSEARWVAQRLSEGLAEQDHRIVWPLIDSGGPYWVLTYEHYLKLHPLDQKRVVADLEDLTVTTAQAILAKAKEDDWEDIRSEVSDPFARLTAHTAKDKKKSNWRFDLLAHRGRRRPAVVDLKTGERLSDVNVDQQVDEVADLYGREVASIHDSEVTCLVLGVDFDGEYQWSRSVLAKPHPVI